MKGVLAIARLTFREGIRMRIVLVALIVLVFLVLRMPFALRGDDTLAGRLQNFLAYSLGALSILLSLATIFFSCATLANELKLRSLHLVVTKPVSRMQILTGKWLGVMLLNLVILIPCSATIFGFAYYLSTRPEQFQRDRYKVRDVVWTARVAATPTPPTEEMFEAAAEEVQELIQTGAIAPSEERTKLRERVRELQYEWRVVESNQYRIYRFENMTPPEDEDTVFQVRYKVRANPLPPDEMVTVGFTFCDPETHAPLEVPEFKEGRSTDMHQFLVRAQPVIKNGAVELMVINPPGPGRPVNVVFEGGNSLQLLYRTGGFPLNFAKAIAIIFLRLALLAALGVFFSVFVSFPIACLCVSSFFLICLGVPFWLESIGANDAILPANLDPFGAVGNAIRAVLVPLVQFGFPDFTHYDGGRLLVDGRYIPPSLLGQCFIHTALYGIVLLFVPGWLIFRAREVAEVQV